MTYCIFWIPLQINRVQCGGFSLVAKMANNGLSQVVGKELHKKKFHAFKLRMNKLLMVKDYWEYIDDDHEDAPKLLEKNIIIA